MFAQKITSSVQPSIPADSLLAKYLEGQEKMDAFHDGDVLAAAVADLLPRLPPGPLALLATSTEPTTWVSVDLRLPVKEIEGKAVVVDPVDAGAGLRKALLRGYPDAQFVTAKPGTAHLELAA
jgi:hypothetical protein